MSIHTKTFLACVSIVVLWFIACVLQVRHNAKEIGNTTFLCDTIPKQSTNDLITLIVWCDSIGKLEPTHNRVKEVLQALQVEHPHVVYAQMRLESGNYQSRLSKTNHNYFGMKEPRKRTTVSLGERNGYASYHNWCYSVVDYVLWQRQFACGLTENDYLCRLKAYAQDSTYINKIKNIAKNYSE